MWKVRNSILHREPTNAILVHQHAELDEIIESIYQRKPHPRTMAHCDNQYFTKYNQAQIKNNENTKEKQTRIAGANLILTKYERGSTAQSARFKSYFQWDKG
jgi:hypothetical protein